MEASYSGEGHCPQADFVSGVPPSGRQPVSFGIAHPFLYDKDEIPPQIGADVVMTSRLVSATRSDVG